MIVGDRRGVGLGYLVVIMIVVAGASSALTYAIENSRVQQLQSLNTNLQTENIALQNQLSALSHGSSGSVLGIDPVGIYKNSSASVVTVEGVQTSSASVILGSGFVAQFGSADYIVTNYHVVDQVTNITVTFSNGDAYPASVKGKDGYSDLAVLSVTAPAREFHPLMIGSSSLLKVGQPVVAIGNPFGLSGSLTVGVVSQMNRTLSESLAGNFAIADVIQFSAPINPGNSGGPLIGGSGDVVGITTAVVGGSQGVGFAIPSDTITRELPSLLATGGYTMHSYMGIIGADMDYQLAQLQGTSVTYGVLIQNLTSGGPASSSGLRGGTHPSTVQGTSYSIGGDIIVAINGTKILNTDALSSYLAAYTLPGNNIVLSIIRNGSPMTLDLTLGTRPALP